MVVTNVTVEEREQSLTPELVGTPEPEDDPMKDVVLSEEQRKRMVLITKVIQQKTTAELEAEYALKTAGKLVGYDPKEDLRKITVPPKVEEVQADPDGWRIIVHDIFVENFKSYKGRQQLGPLHKNLTMIVGPNGSGKSNVIDALLFVFGFKAKKIRSSKLTSLINDKGDNDMAKVEVHFLEVKDIDDEKYKISSKPPLIISRSINKREQSYYYINGAIAPQAMVTHTLRQCGIDLTHNRFLILQGEVESIAQMPPTSKDGNSEGMLEYIEDIVGTNRYKGPIEKVKHGVKLLELKTSGISAGVRVNEVKENDFLGSMTRAVEYVNIMNNIHFGRALLAQYVIKQTKALMVTTKSRCEEDWAAYQEAKDEEEELRHELKEIDRKEKAAQVRNTKVHKQKNDVENENNNLRLARERVKLKAEATSVELVKIDKEIRQLQVEIDEAMAVPARADTQIQNLQLEIAQLKAEKANYERLEDANQEKFGRRAQADKDKVTESEKTLAALGEQRRATQSQIQELQIELEQKKSDVTLPGSVAESRNKRNILLGEIAEMEKKVAESNKELERLKKDIANAVEKNNKVRDHREQLIQRRNATRGELTMFSYHDNDGKNQSYLHRKIIELDEKGELTNYVGRMGDLASIDAKYDAAMSTVFPGNLDQFVVKTYHDAIRAIDLLNLYKFGRGNFFCMDRLDKFTDDTNMNKAASTFPAPRLFDQIVFPDNAIKRTFYHFMGNTLVTKTIDEAKRIDQRYKGRYLICTVDGALIDQSGNITGGGTPLTGRMRVTGSRDAQFNNDIEKKNHIFKLKTRLQQLDREIKSIEMMLNQEQQKTQNDKVRAAGLEARLVELDRKIKENRSEEEFIHDRNLSYEHRIDQIGNIDDIKKSIDELTVQLDELLETKKTQDEKHEECHNTVSSLSKKVARMYCDMVSKNTDGKAKADNRRKALEEEVARHKASIAGHPLLIAAIKARKEEAEDRFKKKKAELETYSIDETDDVVAQQAANLTKLTELEKECRESEEAYETIQAEKKILDARVKDARQVTANKEALYKEIKRILDSQQETLDAAEAQRDLHEAAFLTPEDLDPSCNYVYMGAPDFAERVADDALVMPDTVTNLVEDWVGSYRDAVRALNSGEDVPTPQKIRQMERYVEELERRAEGYRQNHDEHAITQYCSMVSLTMNAKTRERKHKKMLSAYRKKLNELKNERFSEFMEALLFLGSTTQMLYQMITNGGDASLKFMEEGRSSDPFEGGIGFNVRPAKKSWKEIKNLSGGEKTLASLCFVFAMHHFRSTPLYVMDEIDAALDQVNVRLIANYIKFSERTRNAQFMIISLRNQMFEMGPRLIGIYKVDGMTRNIVINPSSVEHSNEWGNDLLEKRRKEVYRLAKNAQDNELQQEMEKLTTGPTAPTAPAVKRPQRKALMVRVHELLDAINEPTEVQPPEDFIAFGQMPRLPGEPSEDDILVEEDYSQPGPSGPPAKRRAVRMLPYAWVQEKAPTAEETEAEPVFEYDRNLPSSTVEEVEEQEAEEDAASVGSYMDFEEEGDAPIQKKKKRVGDESSDIEDDFTPTTSRAASRAPSMSPSRSSRNQPSTSSGRPSRRSTRK